ncbi:MAG: IS1182 family transposase [Balneolaceae bacterium]|nr:IS1182 family transposase [Balneolaceae bacterium]
MQGKKQRTSKLFYQFSLEDAVPADHMYRRIDQALNLRFLYRRTRTYYGKDGQQSIDPVVFFKMCLIGYLNNIAGDRALCRFCSDSLGCRWFLGYDIDEALPVHSTLSRTRALFGESLFLDVFGQVLGLCVDAGMVSGKRQAVDSALIKANASVDSMSRDVIMSDASEYCRQVVEENSDQEEATDIPSQKRTEQPSPSGCLTPVDIPAPDNPVKRTRSNKTHRSTSDPDARIARKPNKPTEMYYHGQISVDAAQGVIVAALADYADLNDHESLPDLLNQSLANLAPYDLQLSEVLADSKYNTHHSLRVCEAAGIIPYMNNPSGYKAEREGFLYDPLSDSYRCSQGAELSFQGLRKSHGKYINRAYTSRVGDCADCPLRGDCLSGEKTYKTLYHSSGKEFYDRMDARLQTDKGRWMLAKRKGIVEPVFGTLVHHNAMRKTFARGKAAATKHVMMASAAFNLRKWLKQAGKSPQGGACSMVRSVFDLLGLVTFTRMPCGVF